MDPVSILGTATGLVQVLVSVTTSLYGFLRSDRKVDSTIQDLVEEADGLQEIVTTIIKALETASRQAAASDIEDVWQCLNKSFRTCQSMGKELRELLPIPSVDGKFTKRMRDQLRLNLISDDVVAYRR